MGKAKSSQPEAVPPLTRVVAALQEVDVSPASRVREKLHDNVVQDYGERDAAGEALPEVDTFSYRADGKVARLLGDGRHRVAAWAKNGRTEVPCLDRMCETREQAEHLARLHAAAANAKHGLPRSDADKHLAIRTVIGLPEYKSLSDREIGDLCGKIHHGTVRKVRDLMTREGTLRGEASSENRSYKPNARVRGGYEHAGDGTTRRTVRPSDEETVSPSSAKQEFGHIANFTSSGGDAASASPTPRDPGSSNNGPGESADPEPCRTGSEGTVSPSSVKQDPGHVANITPSIAVVPAPSPTTEPAPVLDEEGRAVPTQLVDVYVGSRAIVKKYTALFRQIERELTAHSQTKAGRAMVASTIRAGTKNLESAVKGAAYVRVCPFVAEDGTHPAGHNMDPRHGRCKACGNVALLTGDQSRCLTGGVIDAIRRGYTGGRSPTASAGGSDPSPKLSASGQNANGEPPRSIEAVPIPQLEKPKSVEPSELPDSEIYWID